MNDETLQVLPWSGTLDYLQSAEVQLPEFTFLPGDENELKIFTSNPNGSPDDYPVNDSSEQVIPLGAYTPSTVGLVLRTDVNPQETTWELKNSAGEVLYSGGPYSSNGQMIQEQFQLSEVDCYYFGIYDAGGDGFISPGFASIPRRLWRAPVSGRGVKVSPRAQSRIIARHAQAQSSRRSPRHRERLRRAGRSQPADPRRCRHRFVLYRSAGFPDTGPHPDGRYSRHHRRAHGVHAVARDRAPAEGRGGFLHPKPRNPGFAGRGRLRVRRQAVHRLFYPVGDGLRAGHEVVYPNPGFPIYEAQIKAHGAVPVPLPLREARGFNFDMNELKKLVNDQTRLLILCSPGNPTGNLLSQAEDRGRAMVEPR